MNQKLRAKGVLSIGLAYLLWSCVSSASDGAAIDPALELLLAEADQIYRIQPHASSSTLSSIRTIHNGSSDIIDLDYHYSRKLLFWIEGSLVFSCDWDCNANSSRAIIQQAPGAWEPLSLAVDFLADRLYVADGLGRKVDAFSLKGKNHVILAAEGFERPSAIVLDPHAALGFVADGDKLIRMNLDGSSRYAIVRKSVASSIASLAIDPAAKALFWWDSELRVLESSSYIGEAQRVLYHGQRDAIATRLAYSGQRIYFVDGAGAGVFRVDEPRRAEKVLQARQLRSLRVVQKPQAGGGALEAEPCAEANGGCQHACLPGPAAGGPPSCACYVQHLRAEDGKSCKVAKELLLYSHRELIRGRGLQLGSEIALSFARPASQSLSLDADFQAKTLYFADANDNTIYKADLKSGKTEAMLRYEGSASISLDWASQNLYYTDFAEGTLNVVSTRNYAYRKPLLDGLSGPRDVIAHPARGQLYFYEDAKIKRINADGSNLTTIYTPIRHNSLKLALDAPEERLYWCLNDLERASKNSSIQRAKLDGSELVSLQTPLLRDVSAMLVHESWIYVVAQAYEKLLRLRKLDGRQMAELAPAERQPFYALAVMRQPARLQDKPCASASACDKLCFAVPRSKSRPGLARRCGCPRGERLGGRSCKPEHLLKELRLVHRCEPSWEFACRNGRCIPKTQLCDGVNDCLDRSDERGCRDQEPNYFAHGRR